MSKNIILTVIGARPQFVKAAMVSRAIQKLDGRLEEIIVHTGQHFDMRMSGVFFEELNIPAPAINLGVGGGSHGQNTGRMLEAVESVLLDRRPDVLVVYGDTDSTLAGALGAAKLRIPVAHVEAGLRSGNRHMAEEINRVLTDHMSDLLFTPTTLASDNLIREGIDPTRVYRVGDVMLDAVNLFRDRARRPAGMQHDSQYLLATVHRAESTDDPVRLAGIMDALSKVAEYIPVLLPLHPRTQRALQRFQIDAGRIELMEPTGYLEMIWLLEHCTLVVTDSGGLQKEAYFFEKPCVTMRDETEWAELVELGVNDLAGTHSGRIQSAIRRALDHKPTLGAHPNGDVSLFGLGDSSNRIVSILASLPKAR